MASEPIFEYWDRTLIHWRRKRGGGGARGHVPPLFWLVCLCPHPPPPPTLLTLHFYFPLELYVYITLTNNYLTFSIYQLIILWTISINWHRWPLVNNHISKYNSFICRYSGPMVWKICYYGRQWDLIWCNDTCTTDLRINYVITYLTS